MGKYEELSLRQQQTELLQQQSMDAESIRLMDRQAYDELTHDSGAHDQLLSDLEQQLEHLGEIRETGRPAQLTPVQQESGRYENIGHFDKKARKKAAKEAASLTQKARKLQNSLQNKPDGVPTVFEDIEMTKYMEQAELESLKANGYKEQNPRYLRTRLKYLRHTEIILESALSDAQMTDQQTQTLISTYQNVQQKIDAILQVQGLQELSDNSYRSEVDRQLQQPELSPEEADALMRQSMKLLKRDDIDLLSAKLFSPKLVRVNEQQAQDFLQQNQMETQQTQHAATQQETQLQILSHPKSEDFPEEVNEDTQLIDELLAEIVQYKDELGGSPHFGDELPTYRSNKETFFGYPVEAFEAFCRNHIENAGNFFTRGFFKMLAKMGPVQTESLQQTKYEEVCLHLQSMKALAQKKPFSRRCSLKQMPMQTTQMYQKPAACFLWTSPASPVTQKRTRRQAFSRRSIHTLTCCEHNSRMKSRPIRSKTSSPSYMGSALRIAPADCRNTARLIPLRKRTCRICRKRACLCAISAMCPISTPVWATHR